MAPSKNLTAYTDVQSILEQARLSNGAAYELTTAKAAIRWRARAYMFRRLLQEQDGFSPYDLMVLTIKDSTVYIKFERPQGILRPLTETAPLVEETPDADALMAEALRIMEKNK